MTSSGLIDLLGPRPQRATGSASHPRDAAAGAAAFADVIQDASRAHEAPEPPVGRTAEQESTSDDETTASGMPALSEALVTTATAELRAALLPVAGPDTALNEEAAADPAGESAMTDVPVEGGDSGDAGATLSAPGPGITTAPPTPAAAPATPAPELQFAVAPTSRATATLVSDDATPAVTVAASRGTTPATAITAAIPPTLDDTSSAATTPDPATPTARPSPVEQPRTRTVDDAARAIAADRGSTAPATPTTASSPVPPTAPAPATGDVSAAAAAVAPSPVLSAAAITPTTPAAAAAIARPVLLPQLVAPVVALAQAPDGEHHLTLTVSPENLGPVTVRAHIAGGTIHIELHTPSDLGREAVRVILADLRRDLAAVAPHASLALSPSDDAPGSATPQGSSNGQGSGGATSANGGHSRPDASPHRDGGDPHSRSTPRAAPADTPPSAAPALSIGSIDVFA